MLYQGGQKLYIEMSTSKNIRDINIMMVSNKERLWTLYSVQ